MFCVGTILWLLAIAGCAICSEDPARECCDLTTTESTSTAGSLVTSPALYPGKLYLFDRIMLVILVWDWSSCIGVM